MDGVGWGHTNSDRTVIEVELPTLFHARPLCGFDPSEQPFSYTSYGYFATKLVH
jgi:hypothetical protein